MRRFIFIIVTFITLLALPAHVFSQTSAEGKGKVDKCLWWWGNLETIKITTNANLIRDHIFNQSDSGKYNVCYDLNSNGEVDVVDVLAARSLIVFK